jgi:hypothetical protein
VAELVGFKLTEEVKKYIGQLNGIDPAACRYPVGKGGKRLLTEGQESFDVEQFLSAVEVVPDELQDIA